MAFDVFIELIDRAKWNNVSTASAVFCMLADRVLTGCHDFLYESTPWTKSMDWLYCFLFQYVRRLFQNNDLRLLVFLTNTTICPKQNVCNISIFFRKTTFCLKCNGHLILVEITYACWLTRHCNKQYSAKVRSALFT